MQQKQQLAEDSEEGEDEESKEPKNADNGAVIINTGATNPQEDEEVKADMGEIDEILDDNHDKAI